MKVLFYLPVITPWWFVHIITPVLRALDGDGAVAQVHVIVAPLWRGTGITPQHWQPLAGLIKLRLHLIDVAWGVTACADFREDGARISGLVDLIDTIAPDLTLVRSADLATPARFAGCTRFITEAAAGPFVTDPRWIVLEHRPFQHGHRPDGPLAMVDGCADAVVQMAPPAPQSGIADTRAALGLPIDRPVLAVPLHYEHEENFYLRHAASGPAPGLIARLLDHFDARVLLAITDHPLNRLHVDRGDLYRMLDALGDRVQLCTQDDATARLARCADAMVCDLSKCWSLAAWYGTPIMHLGHWPMADWVHALPGLSACPPLPRRADLPAADPAECRRWFGWHLGTRLLRPDHCDLAMLLRLADGTPDEADIAANLAALRAAQPA